MSAGALALQLRSFARSSLRQPIFGLLAIVGVALGVTVVTAVERAVDASRRNLETSMDLLTGPYTHHIVGGVDGVEEAFYARLRRDFGVRQAMPVVEGTVSLAGGDTPVDAERARLIGVDPVAALAQDARVPGWFSRLGGGVGAPPLLGAGAGAVAMAAPYAQRLGVSAGDSLTVNGGARSLTVSAVVAVPDGEEAAAWDGLLLADIATAQEVLDALGELTRIDLTAPAPVLERVRAALPAGAELLTSAQRTANMLDLSQSFHLNLTALSLLSLLVGAMLIFNTETFLVVRRKRELAILRTMGVTSRQTFVAVIIEALVLGLVGAVLGMLAGSALAQLLMGLIGRTSADFYASVSSALPPMRAGQVLGLLALGVGVSVAAALLPAREAVRGAAVEHLRNHEAVQGEPAHWGRFALAGLGAAALGVVVLLLTPREVTPAFVGLFLLLLGYTAQAPWLASRLFTRTAPAPQRLGLQRMAVRGVGKHLHRSAPALAALIVALGTSLGITLMIASFEDAVVSWLDDVLAADYYLAGAQPRVLAASEVERLGEVPGVADVSTVRWNRIETADGFDSIAAYDLNARAREGFQLLRGDPAQFWPAFDRERVVMVTETLAYKRRLDVGDTLMLRGREGDVAFDVGAIYRDYGSEHGTIAMSDEVFARHFPQRETVEGAGVYLNPGADPVPVEAALERFAAEHGQVQVRSRQELIDLSLQVFSRTFTVTEVLRVLAALVAFAGTVNALLALLLDRYTEFAVLRAIGVTPKETTRMLLTESGLMGLFAGICAVPAGLLIGLLLIYVVNVRSFGWSMPPQFALTPMLGTVLLATVAALLAALWPAWRLRQRLHAGDLAPRQA